MDTVELTLILPEVLQEAFIADMAEEPFTGFLQEDDRLKAYLPAEVWTPEREQRVQAWLEHHGRAGGPEIRHIPDQNWNARWEASIRPISVPPFLIRPSWRSDVVLPEGHVELIIDPKMSFGTGYHATTRLMLKLLPGVLRPGMRVLDAGTGTGILAIAAARLGAGEVLAFDIDPWAAENVRENLERNQVADIVTFRRGSLSVVPETGFDLILANINRNVLVEMLPGFDARVRPGGHVLLSGLLQDDRAFMQEAFDRLRWETVREATEDEWWAVHLRRPAGHL